MDHIQCSYASDNEDDSQSAKAQGLPIPLHVKFGGPEWVDRPEHHCDRVRSFPHFQGNYPSSVYIRSTFDHDICCQDFNVIPNDNRHISLTKTFTLRKHEIHPFLSAISSAIGDIAPFQVNLQKHAVFINEERTRTFLSLLVSDPKQIEAMISRIDSCMDRFGLPVYYNPPIVHSTFAWIGGDHCRALQEIIDQCSHDSTISIDIHDVVAKIGDKEYIIPLLMTI